MGEASPPASEVALLGAQEHARAGGVLGRAFYDNPQWVALVPDSNVRRERLTLMFTGTVKMTAAAKGVAERTSGFEAVALWLPPGRGMGLWPMLRSGFASARWAIKPPFQNVRRMVAVLRQFDGRRKQLMPEPHWYLMALGVDPAHQGAGHGATLVRSGIRRAHADGKPIYVETETERNAVFYEKLGFSVIEEMVIEEIDVAFSLLVLRPEPERP